MASRSALFVRKQAGGAFMVSEIEKQPNAVFFVNSVTGTDSTGFGQNPDTPFATIDYAVGQCTASKGDVIYVLPGHVETVAAAAGLALDVIGIKVIGLGHAGIRPQVNLTATDATVTISAAAVTVENILFTGGIDAIVSMIVVSAADAVLRNIETRDVTGQMVVAILTTAGANRLLIEDYRHIGDPAAGADTAITLVGGSDIVIRDFSIQGNFAVAAIRNVTTACTRARIGGGHRVNYIWTQNSADTAITMVAAATGFIGPNINIMLTDNAANITEACVGAAMQFMQPINVCNLAGESSMQINITASTDA